MSRPEWYQRKPTMVQALRYTKSTKQKDIEEFLGRPQTPNLSDEGYVILHLGDGYTRCCVGDYIVCTERGKFFVCSSKVFEAAYEVAEVSI